MKPYMQAYSVTSRATSANDGNIYIDLTDLSDKEGEGQAIKCKSQARSCIKRKKKGQTTTTTKLTERGANLHERGILSTTLNL